jgi:CheY-like chemotaxis protein
MLTADHEPAVEALAHAAGVTAFVHKPFAPPVLLDQLAALLSG